MDYSSYFQSLRQALASHRMSVIVGSGFSKNVSRLFPDWTQLVSDLVYELYEDEILHVISPLSEDKRLDARKEEIKKKITSKGCLKVVSEYIERKGYGEAIVSYIEERTPVILGADGQYYLIEGGKRVLLRSDQLRLHRYLLGLPWNNVYTTNYDPLLEASVDLTIHSTKSKENEELRKKISNLDNEILSVKLESEKLEGERDQLSEEIASVNKRNPAGEDDPGLNERMEQHKKITGDIFRKRMDLNSYESDRRDLQKELNRSENILDQCYTVVKNGPELSLKKNRNIIKLHGSLRTEIERVNNEYGFDGDAGKHYVISVEHYEQYPEKHEAFTQLMRISLLQEAFCLIGFSGDDPNFLGWVGWVRDLLYRNNGKGNKRDYKIYLIDVTEGTTPADRLLFFENHRIIRIPLMDKEVLQFLEKETDSEIEEENRIGSALELFLKFLYNHDQIIVPVIPKDTTLPAKWRRAWDGLHDKNNPIGIKVEEIGKVSGHVRELATLIEGPDLTSWETSVQLEFLDSIRGSSFPTQGASQEDTDYLAVQAVLKLMLPAPFLLEKETLERLRVQMLTEWERGVLITAPFSKDEFEDPYNQILKLAFSFRFGELKEAILKWKAPVSRLHLKAGFLAMYDPEQAIKLLETQLNSDELSEQHRMFSSQLLHFIKEGSDISNKTTRLKEQIRYFEKAGYVSIINRLTSLSESVDGNKGKLKPYGEDRFSISHQIVADSTSKAKEALQFLVLMMEYGFCTALKYRVIVESGAYYKIFKIGIEWAPYPYIFYALQFSGEGIVRRMGQDLATNDKLREKLPTMLMALLGAFDDIPLLYRNGLLAMTAELFVSVRSDVWEDAFYSIWKKLLSEDNLFGSYPDVTQTFTKSGLRFIEKSELLFSIIEDLLGLLETHSAGVISILYNLNRNYLLKFSLRGKLTEKIKIVVEGLIKEIPEKTEDNMFVLGNLHKILPDETFTRIIEQLKLCDFKSITSERVFRVILFFSRRERSVQRKLMSAILEHSALWATGIEGKTIRRPIAIMDFIMLTDRGNPEIGVHLEREDIDQAFQKLKEAVSLMKPVFEKEREELDFRSVLEAMYDFLVGYQDELGDHGDFHDVFYFVKLNYEKARQYSELTAGLASDNQNAIVLSLTDLSVEIERGKVDPYAIQLLLNKVLIKAEPGLEASLNFLATWIVDLKNKDIFISCERILKSIVEKYQYVSMIEADITFVKEMMVRISWGMRQIGIECRAVDAWLAYGRESPFNNVRQWCIMMDAKSESV